MEAAGSDGCGNGGGNEIEKGNGPRSRQAYKVRTVQGCEATRHGRATCCRRNRTRMATVKAST
jgi:hypothetical protein